jgi:hypothetical protein
VAEKEWKDFIESFTDTLIEVDDEIPTLPPKDVIHRIYRDVGPYYLSILGIFSIPSFRFASVMTKHPTRKASLQVSLEAAEKASLQHVRLTRHSPLIQFPQFDLTKIFYRPRVSFLCHRNDSSELIKLEMRHMA